PTGGRSLADLTSGGFRDRIRAHQVQRVGSAVASCLPEADATSGSLCDRVMETMDDLWRRLMTGGDPEDLSEPDMALLLGEAVRQAGFDLSPAQVLEIWDAAYVPYPSFPLELYEDTKATLAALASNGVRIAAVTNSPWSGKVRRPDVEALGL